MDEDAGIFVSNEELIERDCFACRDEYDLWNAIIKATGSREAGVMAFQAIEDEAFGRIFKKWFRKLDNWRFEMAMLVRSERKVYRANELRKTRAKAKQDSGGKPRGKGRP